MINIKGSQKNDCLLYNYFFLLISYSFYLFLLSRLPHRPTFLTEIGFLTLEVVIAVFEELAPIACLKLHIHRFLGFLRSKSLLGSHGLFDILPAMTFLIGIIAAHLATFIHGSI